MVSLADSICPRSGRVPSYCTRCGGRLSLGPVPGDERQRHVCGQCGHVQYLDHKVAAAAICLMDGGLVLVKRAIHPGYGLWVIPGGFMEHDETVEDAAEREMVEETGLVVKVQDLVGIYSYPESIVVVVVYEVAVTGGQMKAGSECLDARIFPPGDLPWDDLAFITSRQALTDWLSTRPR